MSKLDLAKLYMAVLRCNLSDAERLDRIEHRLTKLEVELEQRFLLEEGTTFSGFPEPLAHALARFRSASTHAVRFFSLIDAGEVAIKYSWALAASLAAEGAVVGVFSTPPTLGTFAGSLRSLLDANNSKDMADPVFGTIRSTFRKDNGKPTPTGRYLLDEFIAIRNRERGHAGTLADAAYEGLCRSLEASLIDAIRNSEHLRFHFVRIESVDVGNPNWFTYRVIALNGLAAHPVALPVLSKDRIAQGAVCLWDGAMRLISLRPYKGSRQSSGDRLYEFDRATYSDSLQAWHSSAHQFQ